MKTKLNLGCGARHFDTHLNVDLVPDVKPDLVMDLNRFPYPLPDGHFEETLVYDVVEHVADLVGFMREIHRISRPGGRLVVTTPHFSCANSYTDPTHTRHMGWFSFDYFLVDGTTHNYGLRGFRVRHRSLIFRPTLVNKLVWRLANRHPNAYEQRWAWLFPAWFLSFELEAVK